VADSPTVSNAPLTDYDVKTTEDADGKQLQHMLSGALALKFDEGATYTYIGEALPGSLVGDAVWRVKRLTNADTTILWADGDSSFDNVWNDRASLVYS